MITYVYIRYINHDISVYLIMKNNPRSYRLGWSTRPMPLKPKVWWLPLKLRDVRSYERFPQFFWDQFFRRWHFWKGYFRSFFLKESDISAFWSVLFGWFFDLATWRKEMQLWEWLEVFERWWRFTKTCMTLARTKTIGEKSWDIHQLGGGYTKYFFKSNSHPYLGKLDQVE